jgi:hypothetical protein
MIFKQVQAVLMRHGFDGVRIVSGEVDNHP